ncbi:MAG: hypothetical protein IT223_08085 [Crocinitomicaceae bacterium]|nr:hypothetical protein [Crocinitomicaceae bacterium]
MIQPMHLVLLTVLVIVLFVGVFVLFERWTKHREREWAFLLKTENNKSMSPLRISAFERLIIMLERISPTALVMRQSINSSSAAMLQLELIKSIREEFEHNVSLQMYVSEITWSRIKKAKEETTELIKIAFTKVRPESSGAELCREIFKLEAAVGNSAIREAIQAVRAEVSKYY